MRNSYEVTAGGILYVYVVCCRLVAQNVSVSMFEIFLVVCCVIRSNAVDFGILENKKTVGAQNNVIGNFEVVL